MKKCSKCGAEKDESEFSKHRNAKDGLHCWCKDCKNSGYNKELKKVCPVCRKTFYKKYQESYKQWNYKICCSLKCNSQRKEYIEKMRGLAIKNGNKPPARYGKRSVEERMKISKSHKKLVLLGIHHLLNKDATKTQYSNSWGNVLRELIRERDGYTCQICGTNQEVLKGKLKKLSVHHIDYNKENCDPNNLITLCRSCHAKTNFNREKWKEYFNNNKK